SWICLPPGPLLDFVPEAEAGLLHRRDVGLKILDFEDDPVPPARFILAAVGQGAGARTLLAAEPEGEVPIRDGSEGRRRNLHLEAQVLRVELYRLVHVFDLNSWPCSAMNSAIPWRSC